MKCSILRNWAGLAVALVAGLNEVTAAETNTWATPSHKYSYALGLDLGLGWKGEGQGIEANHLIKGLREGLALPPGEQAQISYALGLTLAFRWKQQGFEVNPDLLVQAVQDVMSNAPPLIALEEVRDVLLNFQREARLKAEQRRGLKHAQEGQAYLARHRTLEGVVALSSGLQYVVLREGTGPSPTVTDTVQAHYRGTLIDGTEFDSSLRRGEPATFPVTTVIKGWSEALQRMKVGAKWRLVIPPDLAYGERGAPPAIGPNCTLIFEVELLSIKPPPTPASGATNR